MRNGLLFHNNVIIEVTLASLSLVSSLAVVMTGLVFAEMRGRLFMHIIFFISFSDMCASAFAILGFPTQGTLACAVQSFMVTFFIKTTVFWNLMMCYQLYKIVISGSLGVTIKHMHFIIWPTSAFLSLLPLVTSTYGRSGPNSEVEWCLLHENRVPLYIFWNAFDWIGFGVVLILIMVYLARQVRLKLQKGLDSEASLAVGWQIYYSLFLFPLVLFLTYSPIVIVNIVVYFCDLSPEYTLQSGTEINLLSAVNDIALFYGISLSVIFFWKSPEARKRWAGTNIVHMSDCCDTERLDI
jgi:hypothetical protein